MERNRRKFLDIIENGANRIQTQINEISKIRKLLKDTKEADQLEMIAHDLANACFTIRESAKMASNKEEKILDLPVL